MLKKLIIMLIRWYLGVKTFEPFKFENQKTDAVYWFTTTKLVKTENGVTKRSGVALNWLLSDQCKIVHVKKHEYTAY